MKTIVCLMILAAPMALYAGDILKLSPVLADETLLADPRLDVAKMKPGTPLRLSPKEFGALMSSVATAKPNPQLEKYWEEEAKKSIKDPLYDAKVRAARDVANEHIGRLQIRGYLRRPGCTVPEEWGMHRPREHAVQQWILKKKFNLDWSPPPEEPKVPRVVRY